MKMDRFKIVHKSDLQLFNKKRNTVFQLSRRQEVSWMGLEDMGGNFNYVLCSLTQV